MKKVGIYAVGKMKDLCDILTVESSNYKSMTIAEYVKLKNFEKLVDNQINEALNESNA